GPDQRDTAPVRARGAGQLVAGLPARHPDIGRPCLRQAHRTGAEDRLAATWSTLVPDHEEHGKLACPARREHQACVTAWPPAARRLEAVPDDDINPWDLGFLRGRLDQACRGAQDGPDPRGDRIRAGLDQETAAVAEFPVAAYRRFCGPYLAPGLAPSDLALMTAIGPVPAELDASPVPPGLQLPDGGHRAGLGGGAEHGSADAAGHGGKPGPAASQRDRRPAAVGLARAWDPGYWPAKPGELIGAQDRSGRPGRRGRMLVDRDRTGRRSGPGQRRLGYRAGSNGGAQLAHWDRVRFRDRVTQDAGAGETFSGRREVDRADAIEVAPARLDACVREAGQRGRQVLLPARWRWLALGAGHHHLGRARRDPP